MKQKFTSQISGLSFAFLILIFLVAQASGTTVQKFALTNRVSGIFQEAPKAALNTRSGKTLVIWHQRSTGSTKLALWGHFLKSDGTASGPAFKIVKGPRAVQAQLVYNTSENTFLLVYANDQKGNNRFGIFAQRLSGKGARLGKPVRISDRGDIPLQVTNLAPRVVYDSAQNRYIVIWSRSAIDAAGIDEEGLYGAVLNANLSPEKRGTRLHGLLRNASGIRGPVVTDIAIHPVSGKVILAGYTIEDATFAWTYFVSSVDSALKKPAIRLLNLNPNPAGGAEFDVKLALPEDAGKASAVFVDRSGLQQRLLTGRSRPTGAVTPFFNTPVQDTKVEFPEVMTAGQDGRSAKFVVAVQVNTTPEIIWLQSFDSSGKAAGQPLELASSEERITHPVIVRLPSTDADPFRYAVIHTEGRQNFPPTPDDSSALIVLLVTLTP